jgi:ubiquinone/menaquinone biosynthesis C-methylase UbiE
MNVSKAAYFNSQVHSEWASREYTEEELRGIHRMLGLVGWMPHMRILEPGCGTGRLTEVLAGLAGSEGSILATDISQEMVQVSLERLSDFNNVQVECKPLESLTLGVSEFDLVICHQVFPHFDDKKRALTILHSCLKPTGRLVVQHFINSTRINDVHRKTDPSVKGDSMPGYEQMFELFEETGFTVDLLEDDDRGYLLIASRSPEHLQE